MIPRRAGGRCFRLQLMHKNSVGIALWFCFAGMGCSAGQDAVSVGAEGPAIASTIPKTGAEPPSSSVTGSSAQSQKNCTVDAECSSGFCDRDICAMPGRGNYGRTACKPEPSYAPPPSLPPGMLPGPPSASDYCGGYHCIEGRCRSCRKNEECSEGSVCKPVEGFPGLRCGKVWPSEPKAPASSAASPPLTPP